MPAVNKHADCLSTAPFKLNTPELRLEFEEIVNRAADRFTGPTLEAFLAKKTAHCSVSNTACLERSQKAGGKSSFVRDEVLEWLNVRDYADEFVHIYGYGLV
jgi:hypothetical protein